MTNSSTRVFHILPWALACALIAASCSHEKAAYHDSSISLANRNHLSFAQGGIAVLHGKDTVAFRRNPVTITVITESDSVNSTGTAISAPYSSLSHNSDKYVATASVLSANGSEFSIVDTWSVLQDAFIVNRTVTVTKAGAGDAGYSSGFSIDASGGSMPSDYEYFIPNMIYKDTVQMRSRWIAAFKDVDMAMIKENALPMPLVMSRNKADGRTVALFHHKPEIGVGDNPGGGKSGAINDELCYGSIGLLMHPDPGMGFTWPASAGISASDTGTSFNGAGKGFVKSEVRPTWSCLWHTVTEGGQDTYSLGIIAGNYDSFNDAFTDIYLTAYKIIDPYIAPMDIEKFYQGNIAVYKDYYMEWESSDGIKIAGMPWSIHIPEGNLTEHVTLQMGFVGEQLMNAAHLYRHGLRYGDSDAEAKGKAMIDFWTSDKIAGGYFPYVWWNPRVNGPIVSDEGDPYPVFVRCLADGMEGLLEACRVAEAYGKAEPHWKEVLIKIASNLVSVQNPDGSFYRAYDTNGRLNVDGWDFKTLGDSKWNSTNVVRFLARMYEFTGEKKYKTAALRAADFCYDEFYLKAGKYSGGTPDNPDVVDKEAAMQALYAFNAVGQLTGNKKYIAAAEHAALNTMSWVYVYDFAIPNREYPVPEHTIKGGMRYDADANPFTKGGIMGMSIVSIAGLYYDTCASYLPYEFFKLYIMSGKEIYLRMARFLQNDTKLSTDYDGRLGYRYPILSGEGFNAVFILDGPMVWLSWQGAAQMIPIVDLENAFGVKDLFEIDKPLPELRKKLKAYGIGGSLLYGPKS